MANKLFQAQVTLPNGKVIHKKLNVVGIPSTDDNADPDDQVYNEDWVKDHIRSHLHRNATDIQVKSLDEAAPTTVNETLSRAAVESKDPALAKVAAQVNETPPAAAQQSAP